jgi:Zn-dependent M28 family amino/carboxypeptidase
VIAEAGLKPKVSLVFFGGEEDSLLGSDAFAEHVVELGFPLHGVINVDMVGYDEHGPKDVVIFTNTQSVGLAREVVRSARRSTRLAADTTMTTYGNSDHVSFWRRYQPAVSIWEGYDHNPYHCTSGDTTGVLTPDFLTEVTRLIISVALDLGGLKDASPETAQQEP